MVEQTIRLKTGPMIDPQVLADQAFSGYRIDRITIGDRQWEGPGITVTPPFKLKPYWEIRIWDQETIFASGVEVIIEATKLPKVIEEDEEMPEEE